jgi:hypothetical protein
LALALAILALLLTGAATAVGATPRGKLSSFEYLQLEKWLADSKSASSGSKPAWHRERAICLALGQGTGLLRTSRDSCLATVAEAEAWVATATAAQPCSQSTTTTGIAASAVNSDELKQLLCMSPAYQALSHAVAARAAADRALRASGIQRGFTGHCLVTLVPTGQQLATERAYLKAADRLAAGLLFLARVQKKQAPRSAISAQTVLDDLAAVTPARNDWLGAAVAYPLSVCPHA